LSLTLHNTHTVTLTVVGIAPIPQATYHFLV